DAGCQAVIEFHDGTRIALNEQTTFIIRSRPAQGGIVRIIRMLPGEVWVKTFAKPGPLEFETPVAKAAVSGTELNFRVADDGRSQLTVLEGTVDFWSAGVNCSMQRSTQSVGQRGKPCTPPAPVDGSLVTGWTWQLMKLVRTVATIRAGGSGARSKGASSAAQARLLAERAAKADAYRNLLETAYGVLVTSSTSVRDLATQNDSIRTTLDGFIRGASLVEVCHLDDGSVEVEMEIRLNREFWTIFPRV
ncbi:MAG: FecR domain-containing protein, partial [Candidatus Methylomirabilaceae bacterium]